MYFILITKLDPNDHQFTTYDISFFTLLDAETYIANNIPWQLLDNVCVFNSHTFRTWEVISNHADDITLAPVRHGIDTTI